MSRAALHLALLALTFVGLPVAHAAGLVELSENLQGGTPGFELHGLLRSRGEGFYNLDLDRGLTPSGAALFPVPLADATAQTLTAADMRLRLDGSWESKGSGFAVRLRTDLLDNLAWGSTPEGKPPSRVAATPAASNSQRSPDSVVMLRRAYGELRSPIGLLAVGRMGSHWGLGMLANDGDCAGCDQGDAADRIAFVTPLGGHIWAVAYDITAAGPQTERRRPGRSVDIEPTDDVRTLTFAMGDFRTELTRRRRRRADTSTLEYGAYGSYRWQPNDIPADALPSAQAQTLVPAQAMARGYRAGAVDLWGRWTLPHGRVEFEAAALFARVDEPSFIAGVEYGRPVSSRQFGAALQSDWEFASIDLTLGVDAGFATGDSAPGFGAYPEPFGAYPQAGELDGPQAQPPFDRSVDNFRFHPDYRVDRILFREIIGTVTDAAYLRPHARLVLMQSTASRLSAELAVIGSRAVRATSTPSGEPWLGVEVDPSLHFETSDGFHATLDYAVLLPLQAFDNPQEGLDARPAQLIELRLAFVF